MKRNENPPKEELEQFYINELHTINECAKHFGISKTKVYRCLKNYGIVRTQEDKSKVYSRVQNDPVNRETIKNANLKKYGFVNKTQLDSPIKFLSDEEFSVHGVIYTKKWLADKYIIDNLPSNDMADLLGISYAQLNKICHHYGVVKDSAKRYEIIKNNTFEKYGVYSSFQLDSVIEKRQDTMIERYGVENCMQLDSIKEKIKATNLERYGVCNFSQTEEYKKKVVKTNIERFGTPNHMQQNMTHLDEWNNKELFLETLKSMPSKPTAYELMIYFNLTDRTVVYEKIKKWDLQDYVELNPSRSCYEDEIIRFLNELGFHDIITNDRSLLDGQEIDIYVPEKKFGIEFNGDYWHSDLYFNDHNGRSTHHQQKSLTAESKGIFLFHIFEHEWLDRTEQANIKNRIKSVLCKNTEKIPARKCTIVDLTKEQKKQFLDINHIQGNDHSSKQYGLVYENEIVACMTFVHPKNNKYTWELSRFCNKHDCTVQGGASKLFSYFVKTLRSGDTVSSYNDITKTKGDLYKTLGFECVSINQPNYVWINFHTKDIKTRYQEQAGGEVERMHSQGYNRVCDCGTKTWVYTVK